MSSESNEHRAKRIYIFDSPRTCSQLFYKLFAAHDQLDHIMNPTIMGATYGPERIVLKFQHCQAAEEAQLKNAEKANMPDETYANSAKRLEESVKEAEEKGKIPLIKEHAVCSIHPSLLRLVTDHGLHHPFPQDHLPQKPIPFSDPLFQTLTPILLIRHPALMQPSFYPAQLPLFALSALDEAYAVLTSLIWAQVIFDCYTRLYEEGKVPSRPIVVDAIDVVYRTEKLMPRLCGVLGIREEGVRYVWEPVPVDMWPEDMCMRGFYGEILGSAGVVRREGGEAEEKGIDIGRKEVEWRERFGEETAKALRARVDDEMGNYEYLRQFKLQC